jgi:hypothetical protein
MTQLIDLNEYPEAAALNDLLLRYEVLTARIDRLMAKNASEITVELAQDMLNAVSAQLPAARTDLRLALGTAMSDRDARKLTERFVLNMSETHRQKESK